MQSGGEFAGYLRANAASIPNYGERYRAGEAISSSLAESTINQGRQQADGEEAANALDATRRAPTPSAEALPWRPLRVSSFGEQLWAVSVSAITTPGDVTPPAQPPNSTVRGGASLASRTSLAGRVSRLRRRASLHP